MLRCISFSFYEHYTSFIYFLIAVDFYISYYSFTFFYQHNNACLFFFIYLPITDETAQYLLFVYKFNDKLIQPIKAMQTIAAFKSFSQNTHHIMYILLNVYRLNSLHLCLSILYCSNCWVIIYHWNDFTYSSVSYPFKTVAVTFWFHGPCCRVISH